MDDNDNAWYLQGELDKWISISAQRFIDITRVDNTGSIKVIIKGAENEMVNITFIKPSDSTQKPINCKIGESLTAVIRMPAATCFDY